MSPAEDSPIDSEDDSHAMRGPIDGPSLFDFRDAFVRLEPMATGEIDDPIDPTTVSINLADGIGSARSARLDVRWTTVNDYNIHYTDSEDRNLRWDAHPHEFPRPADDTHFHPPPNASSTPNDVEPSCIEVSEVELVARAVHACWRLAYNQERVDEINAVKNPP